MITINFLRLIIPLSIIFFLLNSLSVDAQNEKNGDDNFIIEGIPEIPAHLRQRLHPYLNIRSAKLQDWLPDGSILITTRFGETEQIHRVENPGGKRQQITFFDEHVEKAYASPDLQSSAFLFNINEGGGEQFQIFYYDLETGRYQVLTDGVSRHSAPVWAPKGDKFAYGLRSGTGQYDGGEEIYIYNVEKDTSTVLIEKQDNLWTLGDWIDDSRLLVFSKKGGQLYILNTENNYKTPINVKRMAGPPLPDAEGEGFYFPKIESDGFSRIHYYHFTSEKTRNLTPELNWSVEHYTRSNDGKYLAFTANEEGYSRLYVIDLNTERYLKLPDLPKGQISRLLFSPDSNKLGMELNTPITPSDTYSLDLASRKMERWTYSEIGGLNEDLLIAPLLIRYPTFDSVNGQPRMIPAFYTKPRGKGPFPVLIKLHGGPESQSRPDFSILSRAEQFIVNELGIAVIKPNFRGSTGYGREYQSLDDQFQREDAVRDIGALLDWIASQKELDAARIAVEGGSYGGYMALSTMTHYNDRLMAGISRWGETDFIAMLESDTTPYRREYGDERDSETRAFLKQISPVTNAYKITKPLLIIHGLNDVRVRPSQSEKMVNAVRQNDGDLWYLMVKNEGHGFDKQENIEYTIQAMMLFLKTYLKKK